MIKWILASFVIAAVVDAGVLRHRIANEMPSQAELASAYNQMKNMKLSEVAKILRNSEAVRRGVQRAAMDMSEHEGLKKMAFRLATNTQVQQAVQSFVKQTKNMKVKDLANSLRQMTTPDFQTSVRAALDSMMADEGSRPLAAHLKQAWDAESVDEQLKHLNMALDVLDTNADHDQSDDVAAKEDVAVDEADDVQAIGDVSLAEVEADTEDEAQEADDVDENVNMF